MGKVFSVVCKVATPLVGLINPVAAVLLSASAALSDVVQANEQRRKFNTLLDLETAAQRATELQTENLRLQKHLQEIQNLYNQNYGYLSESKGIMEEYYLTIKNKLSVEKIVIENLEEILELLNLCCKKDCENKDYIIDKLNHYRNEIFVLLQWGLMHIVLLSGEEEIYKEVVDLTANTIDCFEIDALGHSILEYAYLLGDQKLVQQLKNNQQIFQNMKFINEAKLILAKNKLSLNFTYNFQNDNLIKYIEQKDYELTNVLITLGNLPESLTEGENLIKALVEAEENELLEKILQQKANYISLDIIDSLEKRYSPPRNFSKQTSLLKLKTFFWLNQHDFKNINEFHSKTKETPLEVAINRGNKEDFLNLLKCNASLSQINYYGDTLLMIALQANKSSIVEYLIKKHEIDPRIYNFTLNNGLMMSFSGNQKIKDLICNFSNNLILEEKQFFKAINPQISEFMLDHKFISVLAQAGNYYHLLQRGKRSATQARLPIILGLYVLAIRQIMPLDENELPWIANKLGLRLNYDSKEYNFSDLNLPLVNIKKIKDGYFASWNDNCLEIIEPEIQYMLPSSSYDLNFNIDHDLNITFINIKNYINNNYFMLKNFLKNNIKQKNDNIFRLNELSTKPTIIAKTFASNNDDFLYYYDMPERDAGYQAIGISRFTAAKLLMDNLEQEEILQCIKIEWVNWIISLYSLPSEISIIENINNYLENYQEAKRLWEADPSNQDLFEIMNRQFNCLYNLSSKEHCALYIAQVIMAPHNYLNSLKYYPNSCNLGAGGTLVALAKIMKFNINIYKLTANNLENIFSFNINKAIQSIDILKYCSINNTLNKVAILSGNIILHLKPVVTHVDLFASINKDSDLGAIFHGWFCFLSERTLITPQNDMLALLIAVKSKIIEPDKEINILEKINQFRYMLSQELSYLLGEQLKEFKQLDNYWVNVAEQKIRNLAREYLLKEHCKIIDSYKSQSLVLKEMLTVEIDKKFSQLNKEQIEFSEIFKEVEDNLTEWLENEKNLAIEDSNQNKLLINSSIDKYLFKKHQSIKKHTKKLIKNTIFNFVIDCVFDKMPKFKDLPRKILMKSGSIVTKNILNKESLDFKKVVTSGISQVLTTINFNENLFQIAVKGMTENFVASIISEKNNKNIIRSTVLGGIQSICDFGIQHHIKFSNNYINAIFSGSVDSILEGIKKNHLNVEEVLIAAANKIANNLEKLNKQKINIIYNKDYKEKYIFNQKKVNFNQSWEELMQKQLINFREQDVKEQYGISEAQMFRRKKFPKLALFSDNINVGENMVNIGLYKFKNYTLHFLQSKINTFNYDLISLDLSISKKILLHGKRLATQATLFTAEKCLPDSTAELRSMVLNAAISSELYFRYKSTQGMNRHRPWELPKNAKVNKLDSNFKNRF